MIKPIKHSINLITEQNLLDLALNSLRPIRKYAANDWKCQYYYIICCAAVSLEAIYFRFSNLNVNKERRYNPLTGIPVSPPYSWHQSSTAFLANDNCNV